MEIRNTKCVDYTHFRVSKTILLIVLKAKKKKRRKTFRTVSLTKNRPSYFKFIIHTIIIVWYYVCKTVSTGIWETALPRRVQHSLPRALVPNSRFSRSNAVGLLKIFYTARPAAVTVTSEVLSFDKNNDYLFKLLMHGGSAKETL